LTGAAARHSISAIAKFEELSKMSQKPATPLIAKLQTAPDAVWDGLLGQIEEAKTSYDPRSQTGAHVFRAGAATTYRTASSGGPDALTAEPAEKKPVQEGPVDEQTYRTMSSGGSARFPDDGSNKLVAEKASYRMMSSGGAAGIEDDGSNKIVAEKASYRIMSSGGAAGIDDDGQKGTHAGI